MPPGGLPQGIDWVNQTGQRPRLGLSSIDYCWLLLTPATAPVCPWPIE
ncbi:MAG TPA: hypothetical protein VLS96_22340 [Nodosilinea sp.]|nr:hypothetical protein [Nodosilinea sp.]